MNVQPESPISTRNDSVSISPCGESKTSWQREGLLPTNVIRCLPSTSSQLRAGEANSCCAPDRSRLEAAAEAINWWRARRCLESPIISFMRPCRGSAFGYAAAQKHFSWSSLQEYEWLSAKRGLRLGNPHDEVLISGICPGSRHARFRLHFPLQHEDRAGSSASAGDAAHGLP